MYYNDTYMYVYTLYAHTMILKQDILGIFLPIFPLTGGGEYVTNNIFSYDFCK